MELRIMLYALFTSAIAIVLGIFVFPLIGILTSWRAILDIGLWTSIGGFTVICVIGCINDVKRGTIPY